MKVRSILCSTDFSPSSRRAFEHAVTFARWYGAELTILHVHPFIAAVAGDHPYFPSGRPLDATTRKRLLSDLEAAAESARNAGLKPKVLLREGDPSEEIVRHAGTAETDLIVIWTHGRGGFDRLFLDSVAAKVVHNAPCAVLTVPPPAEGTSAPAAPSYEHILCAVHLGGSGPTVEAALSVARASAARVTLLHVLEGLPRLEAAARVAEVDWAEFYDRLEQEARQGLRQLVAREGGNGIAVDELVTSGTPYREILKTADARSVGLIVMGVHGNPLERLFFGSSTVNVLRQSHCPVLSVRAPTSSTS